jgi:hypothetical protein
MRGLFYFWVQKIIVADVLNVSKLATTIFNCSDMLAEMRGPPLLFFTLAGCWCQHPLAFKSGESCYTRSSSVIWTPQQPCTDCPQLQVQTHPIPSVNSTITTARQQPLNCWCSYASLRTIYKREHIWKGIVSHFYVQGSSPVRQSATIHVSTDSWKLMNQWIACLTWLWLLQN